jgi:PIN domain nuclease of toxin-antitoxin system
MKILLDTHTFLWFINDSPELSNNAANLLESDVDLVLSMVSLWEIAIKISLNKLTLSKSNEYERFIPQQLTLNNIEVLNLTLEHLTVLSKLPLHHRDPFDRLLIAQAMSENLQIISVDTKFDSYEIERIW